MQFKGSNLCLEAQKSGSLLRQHHLSVGARGPSLFALHWETPWGETPAGESWPIWEEDREVTIISHEFSYLSNDWRR